MHPTTFALELRGTKTMGCDSGETCQFNGAVGVYIDADSDLLRVYSSKAFRGSSKTSSVYSVEF